MEEVRDVVCGCCGVTIGDHGPQTQRPPRLSHTATVRRTGGSGCVLLVGSYGWSTRAAEESNLAPTCSVAAEPRLMLDLAATGSHTFA